jgi:hypothetical protein
LSRSLLQTGLPAAVLASFLAVSGCGPAVIASAVILLTNSKESRCSIPGVPVDVTVQGTFRFQKRPVHPDPGQSRMVPVRLGTVEILRMNCGEEVIATAETDDDGAFSVTVNTPSGSILRAAAVAQMTRAGARAVVRNGRRMAYSYEGPDLTLTEEPSQIREIAVEIPNDCKYQVAGAFNILESARLGFAAVEGILAPPDDRPLTIFWEVGDPDGTYFSLSADDLDGDGAPGDPFIRIRGGVRTAGCSNSDQFDDSIVLHEFGHYIASIHSRDDSPGGRHAVGERVDPRLAWSEGWADFFSAMARDDPWTIDTTEEIVSCTWPCTIFEFDLRSPDLNCDGDCCKGIESEEAVGTFLWEIHDPVVMPDDLAEVPREDILLSFAALRHPDSGHRFVYVGDFLAEVLDRQPGQAAAILSRALERGIVDEDGSVPPFPDAFPTEVVSGTGVLAEAAGTLNGCDSQPCKYAENFAGGMNFFELHIPGDAAQGGTFTANLSITPLPLGCTSDLHLRIYDDAQSQSYSTEEQSGLQKSLRFSLGGSFPRGSYVLVQVTANIPAEPGSIRGQKGNYELSIDVR